MKNSKILIFFIILFFTSKLLFCKSFSGEIYSVKKYTKMVIVKSPDLSMLENEQKLYIVDNKGKVKATIKVIRFFNTIVNCKIEKGNISDIKVGMPVYSTIPQKILKTKIKKIVYKKDYNYFYWLSNFYYKNGNLSSTIQKKILLPKIIKATPFKSDLPVDIDTDEIKEFNVKYNIKANKLSIISFTLNNIGKLKIKRYLLPELENVNIPEKIIKKGYQKNILGKQNLYSIKLIKKLKGIKKTALYEKELSKNAGKIIFSKEIEGRVNSSPFIFNNCIYFGTSEGILYCINMNTLDIVWEFDADKKIYSSPIVYNGKVFFGSADNYIYSLNANTGELLWKYKTGKSIYSTPYIKDNKIYIGSNDMYLYCLNADTGKLIWRFKTDSWVTGTAVVDGRYVYFGSTDKRLYSINKETGKLKWKYISGAGISGKPFIFDNKIYFGSKDGFIYCLDKNSGEFIWKFKTKGKILSSPNVVDASVYFGSNDGCIYSLDAYTGQLLWKYKTINPIHSSPLISSGLLFIGGLNRYFYCIDAITGKLHWKLRTKSWIKSSPILYNGKLYFGGADRKLYCVDSGLKNINAFNSLNIPDW